MPTMHPTKRLLLDKGLAMLLRHGYNDLGIQALLEASEVPKGSFYHHFRDKEDFALQVVDAYMGNVHTGLDACLLDESRPPLARVRRFFEMTQEHYRSEGYMGCLLGGIGQELSGVSAVFRGRIEQCFSEIARRIAVCLESARARGDLPRTADPSRMADLLVDCWEGAALRSRLRGSPAPLTAMLDHYFTSAATSSARGRPKPPARDSSSSQPSGKAPSGKASLAKAQSAKAPSRKAPTWKARSRKKTPTRKTPTRR